MKQAKITVHCLDEDAVVFYHPEENKLVVFDWRLAALLLHFGYVIVGDL